jgi:hypothetical protein
MYWQETNVGMLATADPLFRKSQSDYTSPMDDIGGFRSAEAQARAPVRSPARSIVAWHQS